MNNMYIVVNGQHQLLYQFVFNSKESAKKMAERYRAKYPKYECIVRPLVAVY